MNSDESASGEQTVVTSLLCGSRAVSPVKESSSKNAAMVLKNIKASQGNVCPVDINIKIPIYRLFAMACDDPTSRI
jgi:hypothetical protein